MYLTPSWWQGGDGNKLDQLPLLREIQLGAHIQRALDAQGTAKHAPLLKVHASLPAIEFEFTQRQMHFLVKIYTDNIRGRYQVVFYLSLDSSTPHIYRSIVLTVRPLHLGLLRCPAGHIGVGVV